MEVLFSTVSACLLPSLEQRDQGGLVEAIEPVPAKAPARDADELDEWKRPPRLHTCGLRVETASLSETGGLTQARRAGKYLRSAGRATVARP